MWYLIYVFIFPDKNTNEKHESPHKPEVFSESGQNSSHTRALSEGHNIEITNTGKIFNDGS